MATLHTYAIWQPRHPREQGFLTWADRCRLLQTDTVDLGLYQKVYCGTTVGNEPVAVLEKLFTQFNLYRPQEFRGHSLSMGDVVLLNGHACYCDCVGWRLVEVSSSSRPAATRSDGMI